MIAGETEQMIGHIEDAYYPYEEFFGGKGKARRQARKLTRKTSQPKTEKQERRQNFFKGIGSKLKESGGIAGVSSTLGNVVGLFKNNPVPQEPSDYQMDVGAAPIQENKKITLSMYVVGGAVVVGLIVLGVSKMNKNKA